MANEMGNLKKTVVAAMLIALCVLLPMAFHGVPMAGSTLLPMHIPVLLAGLICGWKFGLIAGLAGPILSSLITGMPPMGIVPIMMLELGIYGLIAGIVVQFVRTRRTVFDLYISLMTAMIIGRVVAGFAQAIYFFGGGTFSLFGHGYTLTMWMTSYFITSLPGIVIQLAFIPSVVMALERERVIPLRYPIRAH